MKARLTRGSHLSLTFGWENNTGKTTHLYLLERAVYKDLMKAELRAEELVRATYILQVSQQTPHHIRDGPFWKIGRQRSGPKLQHFATPRQASQLEVLAGQSALWEVVGV